MVRAGIGEVSNGSTGNKWARKYLWRFKLSRA